MSMPPEKTYQAKLNQVLRKAVDAGVDIGIVPAMMRPSVAKVPYLRHMSKVRSKSCVQCTLKGRVCRVTNMSTERCWDCREERECSWEREMRNKFPRNKLHVEAYAIANEQGLIALPEGAIWGGKTEQPQNMRDPVFLKQEKGVADGEAAVADEIESETVDDDVMQRVLSRLEAIDAKVDQLLAHKKRKASALSDPSPEASPEPPLSQPSARAKRARRRVQSSPAEAVAGPSGTRHSDDDTGV